jgi:vibriolysin
MRSLAVFLLTLSACASSEAQPAAPDGSTRREGGVIEQGSTDPEPEVVLGRYDGGAATPDAAAQPRSIVLNEVDYDQVGNDTAEFVEIYNPTPAAVDLTNMAVVFVSGTTKAEYLRVDLTGSLGPGRYAVIASPLMPGADAGAAAGRYLFPATSNNMRNGGPNGVGILDKASSRLVDALSYGGPLLAAQVNGVTGSLDFVEGTSATVADSNTTPGSMCRSPNGADTDDADSDWVICAAPTPGAANTP